MHDSNDKNQVRWYGVRADGYMFAFIVWFICGCVAMLILLLYAGVVVFYKLFIFGLKSSVLRSIQLIVQFPTNTKQQTTVNNKQQTANNKPTINSTASIITLRREVMHLNIVALIHNIGAVFHRPVHFQN